MKKQLIFIIIIQPKSLSGRSPTISPISPTAAAEVIIVIIVIWALDPAATLLNASGAAAAASGAARRLLFRVRNLVTGIYPLAVDVYRMR